MTTTPYMRPVEPGAPVALTSQRTRFTEIPCGRWLMHDQVGNNSSGLRQACVEGAARLCAGTHAADSLLKQLLQVLSRVARSKKEPGHAAGGTS